MTLPRLKDKLYASLFQAFTICWPLQPIYFLSINLNNSEPIAFSFAKFIAALCRAFRNNPSDFFGLVGGKSLICTERLLEKHCRRGRVAS